MPASPTTRGHRSNAGISRDRLAEGNSIRQTGRPVGVPRDTIVRLARAARTHAHNAHAKPGAFSPSNQRGPVRREIESTEKVVAAVGDRTTGASPRLMTSDEYPAYTSAIERAFGVPVSWPTTGPGRRPILPRLRLPQDMTYATVHKERENDRVVAVEHRLILGTEEGLQSALAASEVSRTVNTPFVERQHGTERGQNARKTRKHIDSAKPGVCMKR